MRKSKWLIWSIIISMLLTMNFSSMVMASSSPTTTLTYPDYPNLELSLIARYDTGAEAGAEIVSYEPKSKKAFLVNGAEKSLDIFDLSQLSGSMNDVTQLNTIKRISITNLGESFSKVSDITSVAVEPNGKFIAVAVSAEPKTDNGKVIFFDLEGNLLKALEVGALPDMVTFTPDGKKVLVANEGEPSDDYAVDPEGTVSIIDVSAGASQASVVTVRFTDEVVVDKNVRIAKPGAAQAQDFEPEYIAVEADSKTAYVSLQENNAIAKLDIENKKFTRVYGLGYKDHSVIGKGMDASDKDGKINIRPWPVLGMYQPDGITLLNVNGNSYLLTANEGDSRDYAGYSEEGSIGKIKGDIVLKAEHYSGYSQKQLDEMVAKGLFDDKQLGRLSITTANGKNADGKYEALYSYGGRSFSIWNTKDFTQVFDSGEDLERITAQALPDQFNANSEKNGMDNRSDNKGPEPEGVEIGKIGDQDYAFVALERIGGIMVYNVSKPEKPVFVGYYSSRDFSQEGIAGDSAPEGLKFVSAENSPTGKPLLLAANEFSGTVAVFEISVSTKKSITILHTNDTHSRVVEGKYDGMGFAKITTMIKQYKAQNPNTLVLDAGDTFHGQTIATLEKGESIAKLMNVMGYDAMTAGNHDFNYGYERLLELDGMTNFRY
ncbi:choice-of-anchor I family protein [Desulfosporosinus sp. BICA1-9]|uniref:choice-of-anchor I family protein n=1 Tax=Desulfosporosinus sp. BICA1-9 TaxID=1531958 RepID=UPI000A41BEC4|nr:choice-of-anchor I family protein [Desulfosporosinus sp. BICA1-9]